jgi:hypothetical protein
LQLVFTSRAELGNRTIRLSKVLAVQPLREYNTNIMEKQLSESTYGSVCRELVLDEIRAGDLQDLNHRGQRHLHWPVTLRRKQIQSDQTYYLMSDQSYTGVPKYGCLVRQP